MHKRRMPAGTALKTLCQVVAAACKKISVKVPAKAGHLYEMEVLRSEMRSLTVSHLEEVAQPLRDTMTSFQGWMTLLPGFLERLEVVAGRLGHLPELALALARIIEHVVGFVDEAGVELFGSFPPRAESNSMPPVLLDFKGEASVEVVSPVLKIMRELQVICRELVSSQSMEQLMLGSLQASEVALVPLPPPEEPCRASGSLPLGVVEHGVLDVAVPPSLVASGQVIPVIDVTIEPVLMAPTLVLDDSFAKELCELLARVDVARPG
ncbi:High affinity cationic amino acid transporter 1 [Hordeum vulgare]|nr:High affinity cationic amino acid transporter 1 [Hordeum vulgare]